MYVTVVLIFRNYNHILAIVEVSNIKKQPVQIYPNSINEICKSCKSLMLHEAKWKDLFKYENTGEQKKQESCSSLFESTAMSKEEKNGARLVQCRS